MIDNNNVFMFFAGAFSILILFFFVFIFCALNDLSDRNNNNDDDAHIEREDNKDKYINIDSSQREAYTIKYIKKGLL